MIILSVVLFAAGVALLMQSSNFFTLRRSKIPREHQSFAGAKSIGFVIAGAALATGGLVLFIVHTVSSR